MQYVSWKEGASMREKYFQARLEGLLTEREALIAEREAMLLDNSIDKALGLRTRTYSGAAFFMLAHRFADLSGKILALERCFLEWDRMGEVQP